MTNEQLLVVAPAGWNRQVLEACQFYSMEYAYVEEYPADGACAWSRGRATGVETLDVAAPCHVYSGGFRQHALNRLVSQAILVRRPKALVILGLAGCTADLPRVAALLGLPVVLILDSPVEPLDSLSEATRHWLASSLASCRYIFPAQEKLDQSWPEAWLSHSTVAAIGELSAVLDNLVRESTQTTHYDYSSYEFSQRDHSLLANMQTGDTTHFEGCSRVLDLACGVGIFLDCLRERGINASGVERDPRIAEYARGMGLDVSTADALAYLENTDVSHDGIYCSHFVEHLPFAAVQRLLALLAQRLSAGGVLVLVFPDPESIRSQLLGFWRDPEHVRFYHPELVISVAASVGLELEWSSYEVQPHPVVPFAQVPPPVSPGEPFPPLPMDTVGDSPGWIETLLEKMGLVSVRRLQRLEQRLLNWGNMLRDESRRHVGASEQLEQRTNTLWDVNQTWAWNDNVTLRLKKPAD